MSQNSKLYVKRAAPLPPRAPLTRSTSMIDIEDPISDQDNVQPMQSVTATTRETLLGRWKKSIKRVRRLHSSPITSNINPKVENENAIYDVLNLNSFDEPMYTEDSIECEATIPVKICKEEIRASIRDMMKDLKGNKEILVAIEYNKNNARGLLKSATPMERQIALLWACFTRRKEFLPLLVPEADLTFCTEEEGLTPLHLAAFSASPDCVSYLLNAGAVISKPRLWTPMHCAALGNSTESIKLLLNAGDSVNSNASDNSKNHEAVDSPLHSAVCANAPDCVALLLDSGADANAIGADELSALHLAAKLGYTECLNNILRSKNGININAKASDKRGSTALHLAAENECSETVRSLLSQGADPHSRNLKGQTVLHVAAKKQALECVKILIRKSGVNNTDNEDRTALHAAVGRAERAAKIVEILCKTPGIDLNKSDTNGHTALHTAALNELPTASAILIRHGADLTAKTKNGETALSLVIRKAPAASYVIEEVLNSAIRIGLETNRDNVTHLTMDFKPLLQGKNCNEVTLLNTFIAEGQNSLLQHPLCGAFLHLKWQTIRKFYVLRLFLSFLFVAFLSLYALLFLTNQSDDSSVVEMVYSWDLPIHQSQLDILRKIVDWGILVLALLEIVRKLFGLVSAISANAFKSYICQIDNILEWFTLISVFLISNQIWHTPIQWQVHLGAFAVLFGWTNLMMLVGQLPLFGAYVSMYTCVLREFAKLLLAYLCLLIGFAISFCVIFKQAKEFSNPLIAFVKVLVMTTGELEFMDLMINKNQNDTNVDEVKFLPFTTHIIFVACLLLLTVALMNLLVGIAVHDIQGLKASAGLSKLENQAVLVSYVETALSGLCPSLFSTRLQNVLNTNQARSNSTLLRIRPHNLKDTMLPREIVKEAYAIAKRCNNVDKERFLDHKNNSKHVGFSTDTKSVPRIPRRRRTIYLKIDETPGDQTSEFDKETLDSLKQILEEMAEMRGLLKQILPKKPDFPTEHVNE